MDQQSGDRRLDLRLGSDGVVTSVLVLEVPWLWHEDQVAEAGVDDEGEDKLTEGEPGSAVLDLDRSGPET